MTARSPSSRRAWIEICLIASFSFLKFVALLAEGVDRNLECMVNLPVALVALLAEGVDRNPLRRSGTTTRSASPSSRRAWIEIVQPCGSPPFSGVALLAEGVDRNCACLAMSSFVCAVALLAEGVDRNTPETWTGRQLNESPSSRRAWIEISSRERPGCAARVALLAEGVDRNFDRVAEGRCGGCRPPRGGRG